MIRWQGTDDPFSKGGTIVNHSVLRATAAGLLTAAVVAMPAAADDTTVVTLSRGTFSATLAAGNTMTCTGTLPSRTCTHAWNATTCFEAAASSPYGSLGCDVSTVTPTTGITNKTQGTGASTSAGIVCTTTNFGTNHQIVVKVNSVFFEDADVSVTVAQTNGSGTFRGSRTLLDRTISVEGSFTTPGASKGGPCGPYASNGSIQGSFSVSPPV